MHSITFLLSVCVDFNLGLLTNVFFYISEHMVPELFVTLFHDDVVINIFKNIVEPLKSTFFCYVWSYF